MIRLKCFTGSSTNHVSGNFVYLKVSWDIITMKQNELVETKTFLDHWNKLKNNNKSRSVKTELLVVINKQESQKSLSRSSFFFTFKKETLRVFSSQKSQMRNTSVTNLCKKQKQILKGKLWKQTLWFCYKTVHSESGPKTN